MNSKNYANKKAAELGIDPRTARAVMCSLTVDPWATAEGSGEFLVHSASGESHVVDLPGETCSCRDMEYHAPAGGCYHLRRVRLAFGIEDVPLALREHMDRCLENSRRKFGADPEHEPITVSDAKPTRRVMADGGVVLEDEPSESDDETTDADGDSCDCEYFDVGELACAECYIFDGIKEVPER